MAEQGRNVFGAVTSVGFNLVGSTSGSSGWLPSDLTGTAGQPLNALLEPLGSFGGPTQTTPPLPASQALGHGSTALVPAGLTTDQRGLPRVVGGGVDIGAVETQPTQAVLTVTAPAAQAAVEGAPHSFALGTVAASEAAMPLTVDVNWGDGSPDSVFRLAAAGGIPATSHTYTKAGKYRAKISVIDGVGDASNVGSFSVKTADARLAPQGAAFSAAPGVTVGPSVATFTDADPSAVPANYTATIAWGDGSTSTGSISESLASATFIVSGLHTYASLGNYMAAVSVTDYGGSTFTIHDRVTVAPLNDRTVVVNGAADTIDTPGSSTVTLRDAVAAANASTVPTAITFDPTVFSSAQTITFNNLELTGGTTTIIGPASGVTIRGSVTVDAGATARIFALTISGLAVGVTNNGVATLDACTIALNTNTGIVNNATLTVIQCTVTANGGGGIADNAGSMTLLDSTVHANPVYSNAGGGVSIGSSSALLTLATASSRATAPRLSSPVTSAAAT